MIFFNAIDQVVLDVQDNADEEEGNDPDVGRMKVVKKKKVKKKGKKIRPVIHSNAESENLWTLISKKTLLRIRIQ